MRAPLPVRVLEDVDPVDVGLEPEDLGPVAHADLRDVTWDVQGGRGDGLGVPAQVGGGGEFHHVETLGLI